MERLEGNTNGGIWIITAVAANGVSITQPQSASLLSTPVTITGTGNAFEGVIGPVTILDHLYTVLGHASAHGATGNGVTTFSTSIPYQSTFKDGAEEGLVMLATINNANGNIGAVAFVKVLIQ
jgi:immunoglobulin-like protein involved in spore germination